MRKILLLLFIIHSSLFITNAQWVPVGGGTNVPSLSASGNYIFSSSYANVYRSSNNGTSWSSVLNIANVNIKAVAANGNYVFAGTDSPFALGLYKSTDYGITWVRPLISHNAYSLAVNANYVFAGLDNMGVYKSTDNGTSWNQTSLNNRTVNSIAVNGNNVIAGTSNYGVYFSTNNGTNWSQTPLNNRTISSLAVNGNDVFAGSDQGIFLSTDNGISWTQTFYDFLDVKSVAVYGNNVFAGTTLYGVFVSINYGVSWSTRNEGLNTSLNILSLCIFNNYIFAGTSVNGVYRRPLSELVGIQPISNEVPSQFSLSQNYPNPFNPNTIIRFNIKKPGFTTLKMFDIIGKELAVLVNEKLSPGTYEVEWNASNYPSGVYFYKLVAGDYTETKKMILEK